jgi:DNA-binding transcriptional MerR regulator/pimeloyl-ACP methyl ester carboxylesterase
MGIGEFARLSRLSPKALRLYDELGLLPPARVDPGSGYRWYAPAQLEQARLVASLRQIGVPLAQIKVILDLDASAAAGQVSAWWAGTETRHAARRELAGYLVDRLNGKRSVMYEVAVREIPARSMLSLLRHLHWNEFQPVAREFLGRIRDASAPRLEGVTGAPFVIYHGEVSDDSDGPVEWCWPVPDDQAVELAVRFPDLTLRTERAHDEAFVHLGRDPAQTPPAQSLIVLETLAAWAAQQHRPPGGSIRQIFVSTPSAARDLVCDFAVPLADPAPRSQPSRTTPTSELARADAIAVTPGVAQADGADLYFERRGKGAPLLLITGGGGDCAYYAAIASILASEYTVMTYDRRGNSRSHLRNGPVKITIAEQSADAVAVLRACGFESARIFGNSGGATIALDLASRFPQVTEAVIAHEPPVPMVLPDAADYLATYDEIDRVLRVDGWRAAFTLFQTRIGQMPADQPEAMTVLLDPTKILGPGPLLDVMTRVSGNWEYMLTCEMQSFVNYVPDLDRIAGSRAPIALAAGTGSNDEASRRMCTVIAEQLGAEVAAFPGGHTAAMEIPTAFAPKLRSVLEHLTAK